MILEEIELGKYRHYKTGKLYQVLGTAHHSETFEDMVFYQALYHCEKFGRNQIWGLSYLRRKFNLAKNCFFVQSDLP